MINRAALGRLSLNQRTTASWSLPEAIKGSVDAGLGARDLAGTARRDWNRRGLPAGRGVAAARLVAVPGRVLHNHRFRRGGDS